MEEDHSLEGIDTKDEQETITPKRIQTKLHKTI